ncbi:extracellular solute-binding protein [Chelatococcus asaccharovorans]|uniref:Multiple sugar transport system substrate-binding protein n=1 Tax=Chelatococcus asaccharovorans TaxID=28210 RepID=A0A2V3UJ66_9HYPH|nr:extracellular solute-binding protein [Chelatococcus asaccharovorans]MBS7706297.1 extracellular solute-binding protein [Chelatococcus asaccharovorans]PXW65063.1 multiple sugar transport system substrate-binding protein [Chelatococcus asaccharovorans]
MRLIRRSFLAGTILLSGLPFNAHAEQTTLRVGQAISIFRPMFEEAVKLFQVDNPDIQVKLEVAPGEQPEMIQELLRKAVVNDLPDVTFQGYNYLRVVADRGLAVPLDPFIAADTDWKGGAFSPSVADSARVKGTAYGLGVGFSFPMLYYNATLVEEVLGNKPFPTDWDDIVSLARAIKAKHPNIIGGFVRSNAATFQALIESHGGKLMSADDKTISFNGPAGKSVFGLLRDFGQAGQSSMTMTTPQSRQAFVSGAIGIFTDSSSLLSKHTQEIAGKFRLGVTALPVPAPAGRVPAAGIAAVMTAKDPKQQEAAWRFLKFLTGPKGQLLVARNTSYLPTNSVAVEKDPALKAFLGSQPNLAPALESIGKASPWYAFPGQNSAKIDKTIEDIMQSTSSLKLTPEQALLELTQQVERLL